MALVLDTGPVLALLDARDPSHEACVRLVEACGEPLVIVGPTLVEVDYWIRKRLAPEAWRVLVEDIHLGAYRYEALGTADLVRAAEIEARYADLAIGFVDAAVIAVCERLRERKVATLDRRHFAVVRPAHCDRLEILPDL